MKIKYNIHVEINKEILLFKENSDTIFLEK